MDELPSKGINSEPVSLSGAITILLTSGLTVFSLFFVQLSDEQTAALIVFGNAVILVANIIYSRSRVTSVARPSLPEGTLVEVITPEGQPNTTTTL